MVIFHPKIAKPVAVRYGWAENPILNLYDRNGLEAPFRTDGNALINKISAENKQSPSLSLDAREMWLMLSL